MISANESFWKLLASGWLTVGGRLLAVVSGWLSTVDRKRAALGRPAASGWRPFRRRARLLILLGGRATKSASVKIHSPGSLRKCFVSVYENVGRHAELWAGVPGALQLGFTADLSPFGAPLVLAGLALCRIVPASRFPSLCLGALVRVSLQRIFWPLSA